MQLWSGPSARFVRDTAQNQIAGMLTDAFFAQYRYRPSDGEINSWRNSLRATSLVFQEAGLTDHGVFLEYRLPLNSQRLDVMVCGKDRVGQDQAVIIELKQWEKCEDASGENLVTWVGGASREVLHPSAQVGQYRRYLEDTHTAFYEEPGPVGLASCAYLHNYPYDKNDILFAPRFTSLLSGSPAFTMDDVSALKTFLVDRLGGGRGMPVLDRIQESRYRPSKKLMDHVAGVIDATADYVLLDEQLVVFDKVLAIAKDGLGRRGKRVIIVKGGPGTGKSVIALNLMSSLLKEQFNAQYATGSKAFTETLRAVVGSRAGVQFKFFSSYKEAAPGEIDVLICDEAHRLRKFSTDRFRPGKNTGKPQVQEVIEASRLPVFLIDDKQVVRPDEVGSSAYIRQEAKRLGCEVHEHELEAQFRCAGSDAYVNWVTNTLGLARTANTFWEGDERFDFCIFPSPQDLDTAIRARAAQGFSARMTAGFCWKWSKERIDGTLEDDVQIGEWHRPWNAKHDAKRLAKGIPKAQLWAHEPGGIDQIGCIYTAQGFEFDYVGVIIGLDLRYDLDAQEWVGHRECSHDRAVKSGGDRFAELVKNAYRVLLSRGMKGCYVHFLDRDTERFVRTRIEKGVADPKPFDLQPEAIAVAPPATPFRRLSPEEVQPFANCVPLYELAVAAGRFSDEQQAEAVPLGSEDQRPGAFTWVELPDAFRPKRGLFVAQVVGESMNRRIPNGAWCLFRVPSAGSKQGRVVVAQLRDTPDSETGGHYTVKLYESRKRQRPDGTWKHEAITLCPDTTASGFEPIVVPKEDDVRIVAELVAVLSGS